MDPGDQAADGDDQRRAAADGVAEAELDPRQPVQNN